jgi:GNAT superfamily N-acetyltransferase
MGRRRAPTTPTSRIWSPSRWHRYAGKLNGSEFGISITLEDQPDLRHIPGFYQRGSGNFWVALSDAQVVGTISLLDIGNAQGALRKMFARQEYRGRNHEVARRLLETLIGWCREKKIREVFVSTTAKFVAAHRF